MKLTEDIFYVGVNDDKITLFEGLYPVSDGMAYNSYVIADEKTAVMDTVAEGFAEEWLQGIEQALSETGKTAPDYLIIQHMEPDHSANIDVFMQKYPDTVLVASEKAFPMMKNFFQTAYEDRRIQIKDGDTLTLGKHTLTFVMAPLVHWPEVMVTYDSYHRLLFSADAFGTFGTADQTGDTTVSAAEWAKEARRYYIGIVGKFGAPVQKLLKKAETLDISMIFPLHGPVLRNDLSSYIGYYQKWSSYEPEEDGVLIAHASVYGNTKRAAEHLKELLPNAVCIDLAREDKTEAVAQAFRFSKIVLASMTYNGTVFPAMRNFIGDLKERNFQRRTIALIENGSWAPTAAQTMRNLLSECKDLSFAENTVKILSAPDADTEAQIAALAEELKK